MQEAFYFDSDCGSRLFGICCQPSQAKASDVGVVFCHAFGEERQKTYRATYLFSSQLADQGIPSLRFDYRGMGDSEGTLADASIDNMLTDTLSAVGLAQDKLGTRNIVVLGIRLGAVIALRAAEQSNSISHGILWNPIVDGADYFRQLSRTEMITKLSTRQKGSGQTEQRHPGNMTAIEADLMTVEMVEQIKSIDLTNVSTGVSHLLVTGLSDDEKEQSHIERLAQSYESGPCNLECWLHQPREYWSTDSMYEAYFPSPTFEKTAAWLNANRD